MYIPIPSVCKFKHIYIYISYLHKLHFIYITKKIPSQFFTSHIPLRKDSGSNPGKESIRESKAFVPSFGLAPVPKRLGCTKRRGAFWFTWDPTRISMGRLLYMYLHEVRWFLRVFHVGTYTIIVPWISYGYLKKRIHPAKRKIISNQTRITSVIV